ncbi:AMP-binding protein [Nostoc sp. C117]|uniref:AMP-binding protein n=1 Tax=Nostoc sp. C117 TaxID=3349875 RepID=UPI00370D21F9
MLTKILTETALNYPQKTAIVYQKIKISYQELYSEIISFTEELNSIGIVRGDCVAIFLPNYPEFLISFYAIAFLNAIVLPLNHLSKIEEIYSAFVSSSHLRKLFIAGYL